MASAKKIYLENNGHTLMYIYKYRRYAYSLICVIYFWFTAIYTYIHVEILVDKSDNT